MVLSSLPRSQNQTATSNIYDAIERENFLFSLAFFESDRQTVDELNGFPICRWEIIIFRPICSIVLFGKTKKKMNLKLGPSRRGGQRYGQCFDWRQMTVVIQRSSDRSDRHVWLDRILLQQTIALDRCRLIDHLFEPRLMDRLVEVRKNSARVAETVFRWRHVNFLHLVVVGTNRLHDRSQYRRFERTMNELERKRVECSSWLKSCHRYGSIQSHSSFRCAIQQNITGEKKRIKLAPTPTERLSPLLSSPLSFPKRPRRRIHHQCDIHSVTSADFSTFLLCFSLWKKLIVFHRFFTFIFFPPRYPVISFFLFQHQSIQSRQVIKLELLSVLCVLRANGGLETIDDDDDNKKKVGRCSVSDVDINVFLTHIETSERFPLD